MSPTPPLSKALAVLHLARGYSQAAAAEAANVAPGTVSSWLRTPVFAEQLERMREVCEAHPNDGRAWMAQVEVAAEAFALPQGVRVEGGSVRVQVAIPSGASPRRAERLVARGLARAVRALREAES